LEDSLKYSTTLTQPKKSNKLIPGINNWPLASLGNLMRIFGQRFNRMASLISVNDPVTIAWLAIMAADVAITTPGWQ